MLIGWVWLGAEAANIIRKMNTEQLALQTKLDVLATYTGAAFQELQKKMGEVVRLQLCLSLL